MPCMLWARSAGAIEDFNEVIRINPMLAGAYSNRGTVYYDMGDYTRAIEDFDREIANNPEYAEPYFDRAVAYGELGRKVESIHDYDAAIAIDPEETQDSILTVE